MSIILNVCLAVFVALLVSDSVESAATGATAEATTVDTAEVNTVGTVEVSTTTPEPVTTIRQPQHLSLYSRPIEPICGPNIVCGWKMMDVLPNGEEQLKYYIKNPCRCPDGESCMRDKWQPKHNSYMFLCRVNLSEVTPATAHYIYRDPPK